MADPSRARAATSCSATRPALAAKLSLNRCAGGRTWRSGTTRGNQWSCHASLASSMDGSVLSVELSCASRAELAPPPSAVLARLALGSRVSLDAGAALEGCSRRGETSSSHQHSTNCARASAAPIASHSKSMNCVSARSSGREKSTSRTTAGSLRRRSPRSRPAWKSVSSSSSTASTTSLLRSWPRSWPQVASSMKSPTERPCRSSSPQVATCAKTRAAPGMTQAFSFARRRAASAIEPTIPSASRFESSVSVTITSTLSSSDGGERSSELRWSKIATVSSALLAVTTCRATAASGSFISQPTTRAAPALAARSESRPVPAPMSSTAGRSPAAATARSSARAYAALRRESCSMAAIIRRLTLSTARCCASSAAAWSSSAWPAVASPSPAAAAGRARPHCRPGRPELEEEEAAAARGTSTTVCAPALASANVSQRASSSAIATTPLSLPVPLCSSRPRRWRPLAERGWFAARR
mmetsp:Transcript_8685/g.27747  ORF Transcript_8685/g.27747 Transcript_8685/m.27747 type:complete len:472 (+) Transcript_8685:1304-2719(+)